MNHSLVLSVVVSGLFASVTFASGKHHAGPAGGYGPAAAGTSSQPATTATAPAVTTVTPVPAYYGAAYSYYPAASFAPATFPAYSYASAPAFTYASAPAFGYAAAPAFTYASAPAFTYGAAPAFSYASAPAFASFPGLSTVGVAGTNDAAFQQLLASLDARVRVLEQKLGISSGQGTSPPATGQPKRPVLPKDPPKADGSFGGNPGSASLSGLAVAAELATAYPSLAGMHRARTGYDQAGKTLAANREELAEITKKLTKLKQPK